MFLSWQIMPKTIGERALTRSQAIAIVEDRPLDRSPGDARRQRDLSGPCRRRALVGFGLTIVVKRASQPYVARR